ncbi:hypothetical protein Q5752_006012 [Cryptotrichosporon argae]
MPAENAGPPAATRPRDNGRPSIGLALLPVLIPIIPSLIRTYLPGGFSVDALKSLVLGTPAAADVTFPANAQTIDYRSFAVLDSVPPVSQANATTLFYPPGTTAESLAARPFHVYHPKFLDIIGPSPTLTLLADVEEDPLFHEATVWVPSTDEFFFVQNAGHPIAGTGLAKSAVIQKVALADAAAAARRVDVGGTGDARGAGAITIETVESAPRVVNPNGGTNYKGDILFAGEGQGEHVAPALYLMNPLPPYNTTVILNNFFGRQFNSLNDVAVNPRNKEVYFTDVTYGYLQDFRPEPGVRNQIWRLDVDSRRVAAVADGFHLPNGITFSPDGQYLYVTDTGLHPGFHGWNHTAPASIYRYDVERDGTLAHRKLFAYVHSGLPDGVHCDTDGNVYAGVGDGVHVWSPAGVLLGKIFVGETSANFQFAGKGRMIICAETKLWYVELAAEGARITDYDYSKKA